MHLHKSYAHDKKAPKDSLVRSPEALCALLTRVSKVARRGEVRRDRKAKQKVRYACRAKLIIDKAINL